MNNFAIPLSEKAATNITSVETKNLRIGVGWETRLLGGQPYDLGTFTFILSATGKVRGEDCVIFANNKSSSDEAVSHHCGFSGDNEALVIKLDCIPADVIRIVFILAIHNAKVRCQHMGQLSKTYIRLINEDKGEEIVRHTLPAEAMTGTALSFGELFRDGIGWRFRLGGQEFAGGLYALANLYGLYV